MNRAWKRTLVGGVLALLAQVASATVVVVLNSGDATVSLIDQATLEKKHDIAVPHGPDCMEITADGKRMWVTQRFGKTVSIVDLDARKIVETIPVGKSPHGVFFNNNAGWK